MKRNLLLMLCLAIAGMTNAQTRDFVQVDAAKVSGLTTAGQLFAQGVTGRQTSRVYIDGLGRQAQSVAVKASPAQHDVVQPIAYDAAGRQSTGYLAYTGSDGNGAFRPAALTEQAAFYGGGNGPTIPTDSKPWAQQLFENSPLQRMYQAGSVGYGFQPISGDHFKQVKYLTNVSADNVVIWKPDGSSSGYYAAGLLTVTDGIDEEGSETLVFANTLGQTLLKRQKGPSSTWLDTYYIYNDAGQAIYIVPPKAIAMMQAAANYSLTLSGVPDLLFKMTYDYRGRLIVKKIPSAGEMYVVYDPLNRPVLMQDARLRAENKWNYIKYDVKGRAIAQGIYVNSDTQTAMQTYVDGLDYSSVYYEGRSTLSTTGYYTNNVFPTASITPLAYSYYDNYRITDGSSDDYSYSNQSLPGEEASAETLVNGMLTAVRKTTIGTGITAGTWLVNVYFYDSKGRTIQTQSNNHLYTTVADKATVVTDFTGKPTIAQVVKNKSGSSSTTVQTAYTYDHADRVLAIDQSYNGGTSRRIAAYVYNQLGQLMKKNLGRLNSGTSYPYNATLNSTITSTTHTVAQNQVKLENGFHVTATSAPLVYTAQIKTDYLQALDYRYNIRGQLLSMNNATLTANSTNNDDANDVFGMEFLYDQIGGSLGNTPYYNGRLSAVKWMSRGANGKKGIEKSYKYAYDELNRMTDALYQDSIPASGWNSSGAFDEKNITYDANGNILTLKRNSLLSGNVTAIDDLNYSYDGNRLINVTDGSGTNYTQNGYKNLAAYSGSTPYAYDDNGNLVTDLKKGIANHYNILNRVDSIRVTAGTNQYILYTYDAAGTLLNKKQYNNDTLRKTTDYIDGFVYEDNTLVYFAAAEGRVRVDGSTLTNEYVITDQQGNARVSFEDNGSGRAMVRQENGYYPFGLLMNNGLTPATQPNKKLYNGGSEWQNDYVDLPDYYQTFFRNYDAALGRWIGVDPQADATESLTPYQYAGNTPGMLNDPMGDLFDVKSTPYYEEGYKGDNFARENLDRSSRVTGDMQASAECHCDVITDDDGTTNTYLGGPYGGRYKNMDPDDALEQQTLDNITGQLHTLRQSYGFNKTSGGLVWYFDVEGNFEGVWESEQPGNSYRQNGRIEGSTYGYHDITAEDASRLLNNNHGIANKWDQTSSLWQGYKGYLANFFTARDMGLEFFLGKGPTNRVFINDHVTNEMKTSANVNAARSYFYNKYKNTKDLTHATVENYSAGFGLKGLIESGLHPIQQFVGSFSVNIFVLNNDLVFVLFNRTSTNSLLYDHGPAWERSQGASMGNIYQEFIWTEPIKRR